MDSKTDKPRLKRKKRFPKEMNPLFAKWIQEWKDDAAAKGWKSQYNYTKALKTLKLFPLRLERGKDCKILQNFGDKICQMIDGKLAEHSLTAGQSELIITLGIEQKETEPQKAKSYTSLKSSKERENNTRPRTKKTAASTSHALSDNSESDDGTPQQKKSKKSQAADLSTSSREYIPAYKSGAYALLLALHNAMQAPDYKGFMSKAEICKTAQPLADTSFTVPTPGTRYTAWSSMSTLIKKGYVEKKSSPAKYSLTKDGCILAKRLQAAEISNDTSGDVVSTNSTALTLGPREDHDEHLPSGSGLSRVTNTESSNSEATCTSQKRATAHNISDSDEDDVMVLCDDEFINAKSTKDYSHFHSISFSPSHPLIQQHSPSKTLQRKMNTQYEGFSPRKFPSVSTSSKTVTETSFGRKSPVPIILDNDDDEDISPFIMDRSSPLSVLSDDEIQMFPTNPGSGQTKLSTVSNSSTSPKKLLHDKNSSTSSSKDFQETSMRLPTFDRNSPVSILIDDDSEEPVTHSLRHSSNSVVLEDNPEEPFTSPNRHSPVTVVLDDYPDDSFTQLNRHSLVSIVVEDELDTLPFALSEKVHGPITNQQETLSSNAVHFPVSEAKDDDDIIEIGDDDDACVFAGAVTKNVQYSSDSDDDLPEVHFAVPLAERIMRKGMNIPDSFLPSKSEKYVKAKNKTEKVKNSERPVSDSKPSNKQSSDCNDVSVSSDITPSSSSSTSVQGLSKRGKKDKAAQEPVCTEKAETTQKTETPKDTNDLLPSTPEIQFSLSPGSFDIVLCIDNREFYGKDTSSKSLLPSLIRNGIDSELRLLHVGDLLWIAKEKLNPAITEAERKELVLDYIIERKRMDDLVSSIVGGRLKEQKFRLKHCGISELIILIEEHGSIQNLSISEDRIKQSIVNSQILDGFKVKRSAGTKEVVTYLTLMTQYLRKQLSLKTLHAVSLDWIKEKRKKPSVRDVEFFLPSFTDFNDASVKHKPMSIQELFGKQLIQLPGVSMERAKAITDRYQTVTMLMDAYKQCKTQKEKESLLSTIKSGAKQRNLGMVISRMVCILYNKKDALT